MQTACKCLSGQFHQSSPSVLAGEGSGSADRASSYTPKVRFVRRTAVVMGAVRASAEACGFQTEISGGLTTWVLPKSGA